MCTKAQPRALVFDPVNPQRNGLKTKRRDKMKVKKDENKNGNERLEQVVLPSLVNIHTTHRVLHHIEGSKDEGNCGMWV